MHRSLLMLGMIALATMTISAQVIPLAVAEVERLANGRTLITDLGDLSTGRPGAVFLVENDGTLVHTWLTPTMWTHAAESVGQGAVLVTDTDGDRVIEIAADGQITWNTDDISPLSDGSSLDYPNDVNILANSNLLICDRDNHRVIEMDRLGNIVWQFGVTGSPGSGLTQLANPHNPERLANGDTLIMDSANRRVVQVDSSGVIVWSWGPPSGLYMLNQARDADLMPSGEILITDSSNFRLLLVDSAGNVTGNIPTPTRPYEADLLPNGNYLVGGGTAYELDATGTVLWSYPPQRTVNITSPSIVNPTSGVNLFVHVHAPSDAGPANRRPAIVFVPGGSGAGNGLHGPCDDWAQLGFVAVHFDPDGRGQSTNGGTYTAEDFNGFLQQDGLHEVLLHVAGRPDVDPDKVVLFTRSYGVTMGSGVLSRYPDDPPVALFVDWEGPAGRTETATGSGGHIPFAPSNNAFWAEREAVTFMPDVICPYVRLQSETDHHPPHPDNWHAVDLVNAATPPEFGGAGRSPMVRVNTELSNPAMRAWSLADLPAWTSDDLDGLPYTPHISQLVVQRMLDTPQLDATGPINPGGHLSLDIDGGTQRAGQGWGVGLSAGPGPLGLNVGWLSLDYDAILQLTATVGTLDAAGEASTVFPIPNIPSLTGLGVYAQGLVVPPDDPIPFHATFPRLVTIQ